MTEEHHDLEYLTEKIHHVLSDCMTLREYVEAEFGGSDDDEAEALERRSQFVLIRGDG